MPSVDKAAVLNIVRLLGKYFCEDGFTDVRLVLFGSWANGTGSLDSDIDLVVISTDFENKGFWERIDMMVPAQVKLLQPFDLVAMTPSEWESNRSPIVAYAKPGETVWP